MTQPFLYVRYRSTADTKLAAFQSVNRQLVQIGDDFGTAGITTDQDMTLYNQAVNWENDVYAIAPRGIWKFDVANSGSWGVVHAFINPILADPEGATARLGFTPCAVDGVPVLVCGYPATNSTHHMRIVRIESGGVISEDPAFDLTGADHSSSAAGVNHMFTTPMSYRNSIVYTTRDEAIIYDLKTSSATITDQVPFPTNVNISICVFRDRIFAINDGGGGVVIVLRLDGTSWTIIASLVGAGVSPASGGRVKHAIMPFGNKICAFTFSIIPDEVASWVLEFAPGVTTNPTITNTSAVVFAGDFGGSTSANPRVAPSKREPQFHIRQDLLTNGPGAPIYQIEFVDGVTTQIEGSASVDLFNFAPPSGELVFVDAGLDAIRFNRIHNVDSTGGEFIWPGSGTINCSSPKLSVVGSTIRSVFDIFGNAGTSGIALEVLFNKDGQYVLNQATIEGTNIGSLSGNIITGLTVGDKVQALWSASIDGIGITDNPKVAGRVFIP